MLHYLLFVLTQIFSLRSDSVANRESACHNGIPILKNDKYYLEKIISDLRFIIEHTKGKTKDEIENNDLLVDSIMFRIIQIAENNSRLSEEFKKKYSEIPWVAIKGMRNKIVHDYGVVNMVIVYDTVTRWIPEMYEKLMRIQ